jgi:hypothetical protein
MRRTTMHPSVVFASLVALVAIPVTIGCYVVAVNLPALFAARAMMLTGGH